MATSQREYSFTHVIRRIIYRLARRERRVVAFRIGEVSVATLEDDAFATVLEVAAQVGGAASFPTLFGLIGSSTPIEPNALMDELARLASTDDGRHVAILIGTLRDDLMTALAAADEG
jgi:hypothetical protein